MRREGELIDRRHSHQAIAAFDQDARVTGEARRIAGDGDDRIHRRFGELLRLRFGAGEGMAAASSAARREWISIGASG